MATALLGLAKFNREMDRWAVDIVPEQSRKLHRWMGLALLTKVVETTPVGNTALWKTKYPPKGYVGGRARGGWQVENGASNETDINRVDPSGSQALNAGLAKIGAVGLYQVTHVFNNVVYIQKLEEGHSTQAPQGMLAISLAVVEEQVRLQLAAGSFEGKTV